INRYRTPLKESQSIDWDPVNSEIISQIKELSAAGQPILLLTPTIISPSTQKLIEEFSQMYNIEWHQYDPIPMDGYREANRQTFGTEELPEYHFEDADCIVSVGCDFLGTWLSPVEFNSQYASRRILNDNNQVLNRHYQI